MNINLRNGSVNINGKSYVGKNISVKGNTVVVDGAIQETLTESYIQVLVQGDVDTIQLTSGVIDVQGNVGNIRTTSGDVRASNVSGNVVTTSGDVTCKSITGDVTTLSGDIVTTR